MAGHVYGPESMEVKETVKEIDYILDNLFNQLKTRQNYDIDNDLDVIIVTDHGMSTILNSDETALKKHVYLSDYIEVNKKLLVEACTYGSISELWLKDENDAESVYNEIKTGLDKSEKIRGLYLRKDIPERFYIKNHRRSAPIVLLAQPGYQIMLEREHSEKYSVSKYHGNHGYDVENNEEMRGIFLAKGKSFKKSYKSNRPVYLIDYYSLFCHLLDLTPNKNSGEFSRISHVLVNGMADDEDLMKTLLTFGIIFIIFLIFISFIMPSFLIFSSVKMTCDQPPSSLLIKSGCCDAIKTKTKNKVQIEKKD
jgi:predicted AlkP superfamily pyrophosphatase or phosphodiesterase